MLLFLSERDHPKFHRRVSETLSEELPYEFMGYSTSYSEPEPNGVRHPVKIAGRSSQSHDQCLHGQIVFQSETGI